MTSSQDGLREYNRSRVLDAVRGGVTSRGELGAVTGLARSTVTSLVGELLAEGLLVDGATGGGDRAPGRPARVLRPAPRTDVVTAVDFGHSHCRVALVEIVTGADDERTARILDHHESSLDVDASPDDAIAAAERSTRRLLRTGGRALRDRVGRGAIGVPAPVDVQTGAVGTGNLLPRWIDRRPADELGERLGLRFAVDNDANLGALAESRFGTAKGVTDLVYVKASTGVGAGLLLGGRLHHGAAGRAGEIGHVPVDPTGPLCRCGNRGCLETLASVTQVLAAVAGREPGTVAMPDVVRLVAAGDPGAARVVGDAGRLIGRVLADLVNNLNPRQLVLGGELATAGEPLLAGVRESVDRFAQPGLAKRLVVTVSASEPPAELLGAAALAATL